jgi:hypothetical protein
MTGCRLPKTQFARSPVTIVIKLWKTVLGMRNPNYLYKCQVPDDRDFVRRQSGSGIKNPKRKWREIFKFD